MTRSQLGGVTAARPSAPVTGRLGALVLLAAVMAGWSALLLPAAPAFAHASLTATSPADRSQLPTAPSEVSFTFNEPVSVPTGGLRVFAADARRVDTGEVAQASDEQVAIGLPDGLPDGGYVAVYRVISADSHPIAGVVSFTVGTGTEVADDTVASLFDGDATGGTARLATLVRALTTAATALTAGAVAFALLVARRPPDRSRAWRLGRRAALIGLVASAVSIPVQASVIAGVGLVDAVAPAYLRDVLGSSFGTSALVRIVALSVILLLWMTPGDVLPLPPLAGAVAVASFALDGHQRTVEPIWLLAGADVVHLLGVAVWLGGVVLLAFAVRRPVDDDAVAVAEQVRRFSGVALVSVIVLSLAGVAMAVPLVGTPAALLSTGYGRTLLVKLGIVGLVLLVALYNRQRLVPAIARSVAPAGGSVDAGAPSDPGAGTAGTAGADTAIDTDTDTAVATAIAPGHGPAWQRLRQTLAIEAGLLLLVVGVTAGLVTQQPAAEAAGLRGIYEITTELDGGLLLDLVVDPNEVGLNAIHLYVLDATGRPSDTVEDVVLELTYVPQGIGPIVLEPFFAGPGHWIANTTELAFPGDWEVRVVAGLDRFTESTVTVTVPVAP